MGTLGHVALNDQRSSSGSWPSGPRVGVSRGRPEKKKTSLSSETAEQGSMRPAGCGASDGSATRLHLRRKSNEVMDAHLNPRAGRGVAACVDVSRRTVIL